MEQPIKMLFSCKIKTREQTKQGPFGTCFYIFFCQEKNNIYTETPNIFENYGYKHVLANVPENFA